MRGVSARALGWITAQGNDVTNAFGPIMAGDLVHFFLGCVDAGEVSGGWNFRLVLNAHNLLLARAAKWFAGRGVRGLDLGTIDTVNAPGLARFKLGVGARAKKLGGTWLYQKHMVRPLKAYQAQTPSAAARIARIFSP